ncbi:MAG: LAGLIDADG family homing endonuclease [Actinomycetota bacterium]|nr:LAGLIDADG family homing endonuclease [Actinomycetota bacterium]
MGQGLTVERRFTTEGQDVFDSVEWSRRDSRITNPDGSIVFEMLGAEIPAQWSQVAADIMVSKYFRKAGVPQYDEAGNVVLDDDGEPVTGPETSARQVIKRLSSTWRFWGESNGYFAAEEDARIFEAELAFMLLHQMAAPNSPQWFNTGLHHEYGITGTPQGFWYVDPATEQVVESPDAYTRPAPHACFINSVDDDLVNEGGIMDLWVREARLFKMGAGSGANFSNLRAEGEQLSGGGKSSGLMSFLKVGDRAAGAIKCLHEETEIVTDNGVHPIKDILPGDRVLTRWGFRDVSALHDNGIRSLVTLRTSLGDEIRCTPEHRFWVRNHSGEMWKEAGELLADDFILTDVSSAHHGEHQGLSWTGKSHHNEVEHTLPEVLDEGMALWLGWVFGDGSITTRDGAKFVAVQIGDVDPELIDRYTGLVKSTFGQSAHIYVNRRSGRRSDASASVRFSSSQVIRFLEANGLRKMKAPDLTIPDLVKSSPPAVRAAFLSGLFEADGHIDNGYPVLSTVSHDLALDTHRMLMGLGVPSKITTQTNRRSALGTLSIHLVRVVGGEGVSRFAKLIGFVSERKARLLESAVERKSASPFETQWVLPHAADELNRLWLDGDSQVRRALAPYCRFAKPRSLSLLRARILVERFPIELSGTIVEQFAHGNDLYVSTTSEAAGESQVYDLTVDGVHEYLVNGMVTHNSGGTTRRAAKMVIVDIDHPDIETFIAWKAEEEKKVRALVAGGYSSDFNGEAYATVAGQNSNNSVRLSNEFLNAVVNDRNWDLTARTDGSVMKTLKARDLWHQISDAAWQSADPGLQFQGTINEWHTCPAEGEIRASNPCSEYLFLDNTACNLASLNLGKFFDDEAGAFDLKAYQHAIRLWTIVLEISVTMAQFPSKEIAVGSYDYRTLGLGYANLGSLLMRMGIPYDSDHGRAIAGSLTAILTGYSYATSAEMAGVLGPFPKYNMNMEAMMRVIRNHRRAAYNKDAGDYEAVNHFVMGIDRGLAPLDMLQEAQQAWDTALTWGEQHGFRNAQVSVLAPTGTIGLLMDCDTTGVEPDFSLVKFKKLAGGGYFKIANQSIAPALKRLGYSDNTVQRIIEYVVGTNSLARSPHINMATLIAKGFTAQDLDKVEEILPGVFEIGFAFNQWTLGEDVMQRLGFTPEQYNAPAFSMLKALGFTDAEIQEANDYICGRQTIEGAPHLRDEHLAVFDTANRNGRFGERFIFHTGHIKMMAAAQPFISGAISKTINMPNEVTREDIEESYRLSWELGLKAVAIYRDGSKASQPLSSQSDDGYADDEPENLEDALADEIELVAHGRVPWHETMTPGMSPAEAYADMKRPRFLLPGRRAGFTQEARVGGHKVFLRTGEYEDGTLGEVFVDLAKEGATLRGILSCFAIAVSKGLQYGVPLDEFVDTFTFQTFEPRGMVEGHPNIKMANSLIDYVFRALGVEYLERDELAQVPPDRRNELPEPPKGIAVDAGIQLDLTDAAAEAAVDATVEAARFVDAEVVTPPVSGGSGIATSQDDYRNSGAISTKPAPESNGGGVAVTMATAAEIQQRAMQASLADKMGDAPLCDTCGAITVRNGSCYVCLGCGGTTGCS